MPEQKCFDFWMCELACSMYGASVALALVILSESMVRSLMVSLSCGRCNVSNEDHLSQTQSKKEE